MKSLFLFSLLFASLAVFSQPKHSTGLKFEDDKYNKTRRLSPSLKFKDDLLPSYSLKKYCPTPGDQGNVGSCVGWATGYGALTIAEAIRAKNTDQSKITKAARSAMYIYAQIMETCPDGAFPSDALDLVMEKGDCLSSDFDGMPCPSTIPSTLFTLASSFKIKEYYTLFETRSNPEQKIIATRKSIIADKPVLIGMYVTESIDDVKSDGIWNPSPDEFSTGGHALCVIGYDDDTKMFEILNSWGTKWGNKGFFKISYEDYGRLCKYGYQFTLDGGPSAEVSLTGNFKFKKYNNGEFEDADVRLVGSEYTIDNVRVNNYFRIAASNITKDKHLYIFSIKPDGETEKLFPTKKNMDGFIIDEISVIPSNDLVLEIPEDPKRGLKTDMAGNDLLCILYSSEEIKDIDTVISNVKNGSGDFTSRLRSALGNRLIPASEIQYNTNEMGLTVKSRNGTVAPIILKVNVQQ